jgi:hypothetical protein
VHQEVVDGKLEVDPAWKAIVTRWTDESFSDELQDAVYNIGAEYAFSNFPLPARWMGAGSDGRHH